MNRALYARRRIVNRLFLILSAGAAVIGIIALGLILEALLVNGVAALSPDLFTLSQPAPGSRGGLANAIVGSLMLNGIAVLIGTPIGILGGTYLAEYGRHTWVAFVVRFANDILLSAPSILIGLFIYEILVAPFHGFSALAGSAALAVIVIPVVVRTTENMLLLVPNTLREAAASVGAPRAISIRAVTWRAASAGMITGVLLALARISGETAPLLFTAFGNPNMSTSLFQPIGSLPQLIYNFFNSAYDDWHRLAWAGALVITAAVLTLSVLARLLEARRS
ncbi:MAG TPA: phosphate ABC transporter permease PstA [Rhizomicrobium sp.]|jgi:phosphate transport system permease protein|nr:phosphate ABC transporter permease PstA [Rhizomicrobium sp.]